MTVGKDEVGPNRLVSLLARHWKLVVVVAWLLLCA